VDSGVDGWQSLVQQFLRRRAGWMGAGPDIRAHLQCRGSYSRSGKAPDLYVKSLVDYRKTTFEGFVSNVDVALDIVERDAQVIENVGLTAGYFKLT